MLRRIILPLLILLFAPAALLAVDADFIVPVTGTVPGAGGSAWQGEMSLHNAGTERLTVHFTLYGTEGFVEVMNVSIPARTTFSYQNVMSDLFHLANGTGAMALNVDDAALGTFAVSTRVVNHTATGQFGQDIPAIPATDTLRTGSTGVVVGPADPVGYRFNFGIFTVDASTIEWRLLRADGAIAKTVTKEYAAGRHFQYNQGIATLFGTEAQANDTVHARVLGGNAVVYGSVVANSTGDPTFIPGVEVIENFTVSLLGIDVDENGSVDIPDADNDGTLDTPLVLYSGFFPNYFRIVTRPGDGATVTLSILEAPGQIEVIDALGTIIMYPGSQYRGTSSKIVVRATDGFGTADFVIPVIVR
ncbi:MAG TPA: hypothetical protein VLV48_07615 [Thermoanaerobaculia bacterium]|nr:hypothetical protein [Thermoanaerobaculia bacterium]